MSLDTEPTERRSVAERRVHPFGLIRELTIFIGAVVYFFLVDGVAWGFIERQPNRFEAHELIVSGLLLAGGIARYFRRTYALSEHELVVRSGLLTRKVVRVALLGVQSVLVEAPWYYRVFGLAEVRILESSGRSSITIAPVDRRTAVALQQAVSVRPQVRPRATNAIDSADTKDGGRRSPSALKPHSETVIYSASWKDIAILGACRTLVAATLAALFGYITSRLLGYTAPILVGLTSLTTVAGISLVLSNLRFLVRDIGPSLLIISGITTVRSRALDREKVQAMVVRRSPLHFLLGLETIKVLSAGDNIDAEVELAPAAGIGTWSMLTGSLFLGSPSLAEDGLRTISPRSIGRQRIRLLPFIAISVILAYVASPVFMIVAIAMCTVGWWGPLRRVRRLGIDLCGDHLVVRSGFVIEKVHIVPLHHVVAVEARQSFGQRRRNLASLAIALPGIEVVRLPDLDARDAEELFDLLTELSHATGAASADPETSEFDTGDQELTSSATKVFRDEAVVELIVLSMIAVFVWITDWLTNFDPPGWIGWTIIGVAGLSFSVQWGTAEALRRGYRWRSTERFVERRTVILVDKVDVVFRSGVHTQSRSVGPLENRRGLSTVTLRTAGTRSPDMKIGPITATAADLALLEEFGSRSEP